MTALPNKCYSGCHKARRNRTTQKHLEKRSREGNVDSGLQVQLEENGDGSIRQSGVETSGLWPMIHWE